ncbi:MAG: ABC transporter ATP-binding protein [Gammaproteobacteria bacterium]
MTQPSIPIIEAVDLSKRVSSPAGEELLLLDGVQFSIPAGAAVAITGPSGSGKSTLLGLLAGLDLPTSGQVLLDGVALADLDEEGRAALRRRLLGFVFQSFQLLASLTALENVMLPLELASAPRPRVHASEILARVGLGARLAHYPRQLSGGEQQRVAIARAFVGGPRLLFADEPTGNLDSATGRRIIDLLFEINREQATTLVMVTHDEALAARCDRSLYLDGGRLQ